MKTYFGILAIVLVFLQVAQSVPVKNKGSSQSDKGCAGKNDKDEMVKLARQAAHQKRFDDMAECMKKAALKAKGKLSSGERMLLRKAYSQLIEREMKKLRGDTSSDKDKSSYIKILHEALSLMDDALIPILQKAITIMNSGLDNGQTRYSNMVAVLEALVEYNAMKSHFLGYASKSTKKDPQISPYTHVPNLNPVWDVVSFMRKHIRYIFNTLGDTLHVEDIDLHTDSSKSLGK